MTFSVLNITITDTIVIVYINVFAQEFIHHLSMRMCVCYLFTLNKQLSVIFLYTYMINISVQR